MGLSVFYVVRTRVCMYGQCVYVYVCIGMCVYVCVRPFGVCVCVSMCVCVCVCVMHRILDMLQQPHPD